MGCWRGLKFGFNVRRTSQTFGRGKKTNFLAKKLTKTSDAFGNFFEESKTGLLLSDSKFSGPIFCCHFFQSHFLLLNFFALFWFFQFYWKVRCWVLPVWSSVSKFGHHVRSLVCQYSRCSKFGILMLVPPLTIRLWYCIKMHLLLEVHTLKEALQYYSLSFQLCNLPTFTRQKSTNFNVRNIIFIF